MCAIVGGLSAQPIDPERIKLALWEMGHRGPDDSSYWQDGGVFLGHNRLAIVDVAGGIQPIWNEDHTIAVVVNGEFYNREFLQNNLMSKGHLFRTASDSELLLHLYEDLGTNAIAHLRGEFAFLLYDTTNCTLWAARDRFGVRPLYWAVTPELILLASESKAIRALLPVAPSINSIHFAAHFQYLPQGASWYDTINLLEPGHMLVLQPGRPILPQLYWEMPRETASSNIPNHLEEFRIQMEDAVAIRIPQEVKCCTHLSGGLDSSIVTAIASRLGVQDAFVVSFPEAANYDEVTTAQATADMLGVRLHVVEVTLKDILTNFKQAVHATEGPFINGHGPAKYLLSRAIHEAGFKVALTGEGSDEIFYGYSHLRTDVLGQDITDPEVAGIHTPLHPTSIYAISSFLGFTPSWVAAKLELGERLRELLILPAIPAPYQRFLAPLIGCRRWSPGEISAISWAKYCLGGYILRTLDDGAGMAHAVESRLPFLDHYLIAWVRQHITQRTHFAGGLEKSLLRLAFKDSLHPKVYDTPKHPFMSPPLQAALIGPHRSLVLDPILDSALPIFKHDCIQAWTKDLTARAQSGQIVPSDEPVLATLLSFAHMFEPHPQQP